MNRAMVSKYQGNVMDMTRSRRYLSLITGVIVAGVVTFIPELEAYRGQLYFSIALLTGLLMGLYGVEDIVNAFISGRLPELVGEPAAPQQPPSSPPAQPPIPPEPIEPTLLPHATITIENSGDVFKAPDGRKVWLPEGMVYRGEPRDLEGGEERVHPNSDFGDWEGLRIHLDHTAGKFLFVLTQPIDFPSGVQFIAWLNFKLKAIPKPEVTAPINHWLFWELLIDGELVDFVPLHNGDTSVQFGFIGRGRPVTLGFRLRLDWANLTGSSELEWQEAGYGHTIGAELS